jgi:hypothetical protein
MEPRTIDPLIRLPYEIWCECISFAIADLAEGPLPLVQVSSRWSEAILDTPSLWTTVIIDHGEDEAARIHTFLSLSKNQTLDVRVLVPLSHSENLEIVVSEASRLRSFSIFPNRMLWTSDLSRQAAKLLETLAKGSQSYPQMQLLEVSDNIYPVISPKLLQACPNLKELRNLPVETVSSLGNDIRSINVYQAIPRVATEVYRIKNLRSLHLSYSDNQSDDGWSEHLGQLAIQPAGQLRELTLAILYIRIHALPLIIAAFPDLRSLELRFLSIGKGSPQDIPPFHPPDMRHIRTFTLVFVSNVAYGKRLSTSVGKILRLFTLHRALNNLKTLYFYSTDIPCYPNEINALLRSAINVHTLAIHLGSDSSSHYKTLPDIGIEIPTMDKLVDVALTPSFLINHLSAPNAIQVSLESLDILPLIKAPGFGPNISRLSIASTEFDSINADMTPVEISRRWRALQCIRVSSLSRCRNILSLAFIRVVEFSRSPQARGYHAGFNTFLLNLLRNKDACPHLETMKSATYPSWNLLFEVLYYRSSSLVSSIRKVFLPSYPPIFILSPLVLLIQGRVTLATVDLPDIAILNLLRDPKVFVDFVSPFMILIILIHRKACTFCITAGHVHCFYRRPRGLFALERRTEIKQTGYKTQNPLRKSEKSNPLERVVEELQSSILDRDIQCKPDNCSRHSGTVEINEYTLEGNLM